MARIDLHRLGEERSIAMHRVIAERLELDPSILVAARVRVNDWLRTGSVHRTYADAWRVILEDTPERIAARLVDRGEEANALRQVSPFAGVLDARTRWKIHRDTGRALR